MTIQSAAFNGVSRVNPYVKSIPASTDNSQSNIQSLGNDSVSISKEGLMLSKSQQNNSGSVGNSNCSGGSGGSMRGSMRGSM